MEGVAEERGGGGGSSRQVIPEAAMDALRRTSKNIDELHANMDQFLSACDADTLSRMSPLERAHCLLLLSKAATTVYACMEYPWAYTCIILELRFVGFLHLIWVNSWSFCYFQWGWDAKGWIQMNILWSRRLYVFLSP